MILIDSSGWIEYFTDGPKSDHFYREMNRADRVVTPSIVLYEVYKLIKRERSEQDAMEAVAQMSQSHVIPLTEEIALSAADVSLEFKLPMADAIVYATALDQNCKVLTLDADFKSLPSAIVL